MHSGYYCELNGCQAYNFLGSNAIGVWIGSGPNACYGSIVDNCATGISIYSLVVVSGNHIANCTTAGINIGTIANSSITNNFLYTNSIGINLTGSATQVQISDNYFNLGATGVSLHSGATGTVQDNYFSGQTTLPVTDNSTGGFSLRNNVGAPNYAAGQRTTQGTSATLLGDPSIVYVATGKISL